MSDTSASSWVTDHPFSPGEGNPWWSLCATCGLSEAAHERTVMSDTGEQLHPDVAMFTTGLERDPDGQSNIAAVRAGDADCGRVQELIDHPVAATNAFGLPGVGSVGRPPSHYTTEAGMDVFDVVEAFGLDYFEGNAVKYILRWRKKGGIADLRKAQHYIEEVIVRSTEAPQ